MSTDVNIGSLDQQIVIQSKTVEMNRQNEAIPTWVTFATVWAQVDYNSGSENFEANKKTATGMMQFLIRYKYGIDEQMQITYDSDIYDIINVSHLGRKKWTILKTQRKD